MKLTFQGLIEIAPEEEAKLWAYGRLFGRAERSLHAALERGEVGSKGGRFGSLHGMRDWVAERFGMTGAQATSVCNRVKGMRASIVELRKEALKNFEASKDGKRPSKVNAVGLKQDKVYKRAVRKRAKAADARRNAERWRAVVGVEPEAAETVRDYMRVAFQCDKEARGVLRVIPGLRRRAALLGGRHRRLQDDHAAGRIRVCFGGKKLLQQRERIGEPSCPFRTVAEWRAAWDAARDGSVYCEGVAQQKHGNQSVKVSVIEGHGFGLEVMLPPSMREEHGRKIGFMVRWNEQLRPWVGALANMQASERGNSKDAFPPRIPISYRFKYRHDKKRWYVLVTLEVQEELHGPSRNGAVGLDLNAEKIAMVRIDGEGNLRERRTYRLPGPGASAGATRSAMGRAMRDVGRIAAHHHVPIVIEDLDFRQKKEGLRYETRRRARGLSAFAYALYKNIAQSRAAKTGVKLMEVNPAFTSVKGIVLYGRRCGLSADESAAMVIARKGLNEFLDSQSSRARDERATKQICAGQRTGAVDTWKSWLKVSKKLKAFTRHELCSCKGKLEVALSGPPSSMTRSRPAQKQATAKARVGVVKKEGDLLPGYLPSRPAEKSHPVGGVATQPGLFDGIEDL